MGLKFSEFELLDKANGIYKKQEDIPIEKISFTFCCTIVDDNYVNNDGIDYFVEEDLSGLDTGQKVWLFI